MLRFLIASGVAKDLCVSINLTIFILYVYNIPQNDIYEAGHKIWFDQIYCGFLIEFLL